MGSYGWLLNPINLWVAWRDSWMFGGKRYRRVVAISERGRRELKEHYHVPDDQIVTIPNGINLARFNPRNARSRDEVRRSLACLPRSAVAVLAAAKGSRTKVALWLWEMHKDLLVVGETRRSLQGAS